MLCNRRLRPPRPPATAAVALPAGPSATLALCLALLLSGCQSIAPPPTGNLTTVTLEAVGGDQCVKVTPHTAEIWSQEVAGKPNQVRWVIRGATPYRWVIDFKEVKGQKDHFGQRVLPCRAPGQAVTSGLPTRVTHSPGDHVEWDYRVTLLSCEAGPPEEICEADPVIIIRDVQF